MSKTKDNRIKGIIFIILSGFGFALMSLFIKLSGDLPVFEKVIFRNLVSLFVAGALIIKHNSSFIGKKENRPYLLLRSLFGAFGMIFNFYAIDHMAIADASMINKISPFLVVLFSFLFLKENAKIQHLITILMAFIGAMFIVKPSFSVEVIPYAIAIVGAVFAGLAYTCLRKISANEGYYTTVFFFSAFTIIFNIVPFILNYKPMSLNQFLCLMMAGVGASLGQFGITLAYTYAPAREISIFDYSNVIFSALLGFFIFGEVPDVKSTIGYVIIFLSAFYMFNFNKKTYGEQT